MTFVAPRRRVCHAFTLVELLVVIGIIALLISILLPTLSNARRQANVVKCASNLRQVGLGLQMYAQQYNGQFPGSYMPSETYTLTDAGLPGGSLSITNGGVYWWQRLQIEKLLPGAGTPSKSPFVCPSDITNYEPFDIDNTGPALASMCQCSYGINNFLTIQATGGVINGQSSDYTPTPGTNAPELVDSLANPFNCRRTPWPKALFATRSSEKVVATDLTFGYVIDWSDPNTVPNAGSVYPFNNQIDWRRHSSTKNKVGTANVLYLDGHVSAIRQNPNGSGGHDPANTVNDINGYNYVSTTVVAKMMSQSQPY